MAKHQGFSIKRLKLSPAQSEAMKNWPYEDGSTVLLGNARRMLKREHEPVPSTTVDLIKRLVGKHLVILNGEIAFLTPLGEAVRAWYRGEGFTGALAMGNLKQPVKGFSWYNFESPITSTTKGWTEPELPPFHIVFEIARGMGYSIGLHGSMMRDCDLIALPWVENHSSPQALVDALCEALDAKQVSGFEIKPAGRVAVNIQMDGWYKLIDLSIMTTGDGF